MKQLLRALAAAVALALVAAPALAANNVHVKDGGGADATICALDTGAGVEAPCAALVDTTGAKIDPATKQDQQSSQAAAGADASKAQAVQGLTGGKAIATKTADGDNIGLGATTDGACAGDATSGCSLEARVIRLNQRISSLITALNSPFQAGGSIGNTAFTANAGTNLNTSALALDVTAGTANTDLGPPGATACATDTGSCSLNALVQRLAQRLTTLNSTLGSPFQAGASIGNAAFTANAGTNLNTSALALDASVGTSNTDLGPPGATACATDTGSCSLNALLQRIAQRLTTLNTTAGAPVLGAGEAHAAEVGGNQITVQVAQTVTASSAYTTGNSVGNLMTISNAARVSGAAGAPGTSGLLQSVVANMKSNQGAQIDVFIFSANPTGTTCIDKTPFALAAADFDKGLGFVPIFSWANEGTPSMGQAQNQGMPYALSSSTTLYACAVVRGTPTYASTSDVTFTFRLLRN